MREAVLFDIFLDLCKAYDALDRGRSLDLLAEYRVGPRTVRIFRMYWDGLTMLAKAGRYFGHQFKGYRGVTQGKPLSPTIFNVVVDAVIYHWLTVVMPSEAGMGGLGMIIIDLMAYLYATNGLVESTQPKRIQRVFDVLTSLFDLQYTRWLLHW